jgi:hypothetical protein
LKAAVCKLKINKYANKINKECGQVLINNTAYVQKPTDQGD